MYINSFNLTFIYSSACSFNVNHLIKICFTFCIVLLFYIFRNSAPRDVLVMLHSVFTVLYCLPHAPTSSPRSPAVPARLVSREIFAPVRTSPLAKGGDDHRLRENHPSIVWPWEIRPFDGNLLNGRVFHVGNKTLLSWKIRPSCGI